ncbi:MAG: bifunctional folylpolyglutamate synthase/dihydrofolate synthase [Bacteroidales bacterium]|nr:bifunctional folylpolyglutamate synthase/dihydrofolate synthase [Bacteroidales bacterium]
MTTEQYNTRVERLFSRHQSFQSAGSSAYKPGLGNMEFIDQMAGHPHRRYRTVHVAGTNGKGSVSNMLASAIASTGLRVGLYTSPHILDFRERMRVVDNDGVRLISRGEVWDFLERWEETADHIGMSFFEITTAMAFDFFASAGVDIAVIETGLGGRLDSTNIIKPVLSVITNIGLDHCDILGSTLPEIAFEKAGIIKEGVPAVIGESSPETDPIFERKFRYTNLSLVEKPRLVFADKEPVPEYFEGLLGSLDLAGNYQRANLRTVLAALAVLGIEPPKEALARTAARTGFHGRWETVSKDPWIICDIGHNAHGLKYNFARLSGMLSSGEISDLTIVYGSVFDKDVDAALALLPKGARYIFTNAASSRAMAADEVLRRFLALGGDPASAVSVPSVSEAMATAGVSGDENCATLGIIRGGTACGGVGEADVFTPDTPAVANGNSSMARRLIYVGGSTYVVAEAMAFLKFEL